MTPPRWGPGDPGASRRRRRLYEEEPRAEPEESLAPPEESRPASEEAREEPAAAPTPAEAAEGPDTLAVPEAEIARVAAAREVGALIGRQAEASRIVKKYVYWSIGLGLVAVPVLGTAAILGVQIKMVRDLAQLYGIPFSRHRAKAVIAALVGGLGTAAIGRPLLLHFALAVPLAWPLIPAASATAASAMTYAIGRVFTHHFELGGTLLSFRPEETRAFFEAERRRLAG